MNHFHYQLVLGEQVPWGSPKRTLSWVGFSSQFCCAIVWVKQIQRYLAALLFEIGRKEEECPATLETSVNDSSQQQLPGSVRGCRYWGNVLRHALDLTLTLDYKGIARTQSPTNKNYAFELPTFGVIVGVSPSVVQWTGLTLEEPPSWSRLTSKPGKYAEVR